MHAPEARLSQVIDRFEQVEARLGAAGDPDEIVKLSKEHAELKPVVEKAREVISARQGLEEAEALVSSGDAEMAELARMEIDDLKERLPDLEHDMQILLLPKDVDDAADIVLEVRAGTGGDEAALFAGDLFRMYSRYAQIMGWKVDVVDASEGEVGGYKEIVANVSGDGVFGHMKWESGVHRVQRVPATETQGRIHTSAATVAVLPAPENIEIDVKPEDIRIDTMRSSGAGGQHVNTTDSAVQVTHIPTGIMVKCQDGRSQGKNKEKALQILRSKLLEAKIREEAEKYSAHRKNLIGSGGREEKIRTYNFPQTRLTDHRVNLTLYNLDAVMAGQLEEIIGTLQTEEMADRLAELEAS